MKKFLAGAAVFAAMLGGASAVQAQKATDGGQIYGFSGGLTIPNGTLGDINGTGLNLQAHATLKPSSIPFALRGDLGLFTTSGKTLPGTGSTAGPNYSGATFFTLNANGVYNFEGAKDATFVPYVIGGAGLYAANGGRGTKFGINAGGGVTFKLSGFDAFAEARIHNVFSDGYSSRLIPISFGIMFKP